MDPYQNTQPPNTEAPAQPSYQHGVGYPTNVNTKPPIPRWVGPISIVSIVLAAMGFLPSLIFLFNAIGSFSFHFGIFAFFFIGFAIHGIGVLLGLTALIMGVKVRGIVGLAGNALEIFIAIIGLLAALF